MEFRLKSIRHQIILFVVTGLLLLTNLDKIEVNIMEARNFISAREMVQNKEYLLTTLNNEPRYQKPPLPTWLTAIAGSLSGFESLAVLRLPVVAITFLLVFIFYCFSKLIGLNSEHSFNNALILITSFYIFFAGRDNQWDMYTHSFMMVNIVFLWKLLKEDSNALLNSILGGLFFGLSFLSKGPISVYVLLIPFLISYGLVYHFSFRKKILYLLIMLITGLSVGLSWYMYVHIKDPVYFSKIVTHETTSWANYEVQPFYYYWNFFLQSGLWAIPSLTALIYPYLKSRTEDLKTYRFAILWTIISVILMSIIPEKKVRYLVPVLIPLALTTGFYIEYLMKNFKRNMSWKENIWIFFSFGIIALIGFLYPFAGLVLLKDTIREYLLLFILSSLLMYLFAFLIINGLIRRNFRIIFFSMIFILVLIVIIAIPMRAKVFINPGFASAKEAQIISEKYRIETYRISDIAPEIVWDFGESIPLPQKDGDRYLIPDGRSFALIADKADSLTIISQFIKYDIDRKYIINMNYGLKNKVRYIKDYYILTKKDE
jgi:4-amino-4-deoxy-L-arabinose transferase-like glycosyltransferase